MQSKLVQNIDYQNSGFQKLIIWQKGREFVKLVYQKTECFPRSEIHGLQSQMRRAIISYLLNIVEGKRRNTQKDFLKFLNIAEASLSEVEACLIIAFDLGYFSQNDFDFLELKRRELAIMTSSFVKSVKRTL